MRNQYYLQDKGKLKDALAGLVRCLSLLPWNKEETDLHNKVFYFHLAVKISKCSVSLFNLSFAISMHDINLFAFSF